MSLNRILACSSSKAGNSDYLVPLVPLMKDFLGDAACTIAFIPFASVGNSESYVSMVRAGLRDLPYTVTLVKPENAVSVIETADVIMVGGGNTFKLLHDIYVYKLLDLIRDKVNKGIPYIGWSAGANITGPTIGTTNDMPVIEPKSFNALGLLPFQLNPHYNNQKLEGHHGESRDQRLEEFVLLNPGLAVVGLPEGSALKLENGRLQFIGTGTGVIFEMENVPVKKEISNLQDITYLL